MIQGRLLCMFQIGRDNDQISCFDGIGFVTEEKISSAPGNKEQFCKVMGVENAGPVLLIFGKGDGKKTDI